MRSTTVALVIVVALALGLCTASLMLVERTVNEMDDLRVQTQELARAGNNMGAMENLIKIASLWEKARPYMEILISHEGLHDIRKNIVDAQVCLELGDLDDFFRVLARIGDNFEHLRETEKIKLTNIL